MEKNTENKIQAGNFIITTLEKIVSMERKYGFFNLLKSLIIIGICIILTIFAFNPEKLVEIYDTFKDKQHKEMMDRRIAIEPELRMIIKDLRIATNASRAYICEFHNGTNNLNGMPFLYADMRYEDVANGVINVDYDYQNQPLSRYPLASIIFEDEYWFGSVDDLIKIDERLGTRLKFNNVQWVAFIALKQDNQKIGVLGLSYTEIPEFEQQKAIGKAIRNDAVNISILLGSK